MEISNLSAGVSRLARTFVCHKKCSHLRSASVGYHHDNLTSRDLRANTLARDYRINPIDAIALQSDHRYWGREMEAIVGVLAVVIVGGAAVFSYAVYLTSGSQSESRSSKHQL